MAKGIAFSTNLPALRAQRLLNEVDGQLSRSLERLSSGQRINRPSDDATSLGIANGLTLNRRVYSQGIRNVSDGVSALSIAEGAVDQLTSIVTRLSELAGQGANGSFSLAQRKALQSEGEALSDEYTRIVETTSFNGRRLFLESSGIRVQGGFGVNGSIGTTVGGQRATGTFTATATTSTGSSDSFSASARDINGDGIPDLVSVALLDTGVGATIQLGRGDGSFNAATSILLADGFADGGEVKLADLNNDGNLDIIASAGERIYTLQGNGNGTFQAAQTLAVLNGARLRSFDVGDVDGDGDVDIVVANGVLNTFSNNGSGSFGAATTRSVTDYSITRVRLADVNNDGLLDAVTAGQFAGTGVLGDERARLAVLTQAANGTYSVSYSRDFGTAAVLAGDQLADFAIGDLNNDGRVDIVISAEDSGGFGFETTILRGTGSSFAVQTATSSISLATVIGLNSFELQDINGDGNLDIVSTGDATSLQLYSGSGNFTFTATPAPDAPSDFFRGFAFADLNRDGVLDILLPGAGTSGGEVRTLQGNTQLGAARLLDFSLLSIADARQALSLFSYTLDNLTKQRGEIGAFQSRLESAVNTLQSGATQFAASASRITDVDVATESARLIRLQILRDAGTAVLAQANQQPELALRLLGSTTRE